jgi:hypothetical protein
MEQPSVVHHVEQPHDLADPSTDDGQGGARVLGAEPTFDLQKGERHGGEDDVMRPALVGAAFEVIEPEIVLQLAILLFDGPSAARERDEVDERRRRWQMEQVVLPHVGRRALAE